MLFKHKLSHLPIPIEMKGEELAFHFPQNHFHFILSRNALDHTENPILTIANMMYVLKPTRHIYIEVQKNEASRQKYDGLHQWNFAKTNSQSLALWRPGQKSIDIQKLFSNIRVNCTNNVRTFDEKEKETALACILTKQTNSKIYISREYTEAYVTDIDTLKRIRREITFL